MWNINAVVFVFMTNIYSILTLPKTHRSALEEKNTFKKSSSDLLNILMRIFEYSDEDVIQSVHKETNETAKIRVKRQGWHVLNTNWFKSLVFDEASKFTEAAKSSHGKTFRLIVQMFTNLIGSSAIGGSRPLPPLPKPVIRSFKQHFLEAFYPESEVKRDN